MSARHAASLLPVTLLGGCLSLHSYRNVDVRVTDAETGSPVPAVVTVTYASAWTLNPPRDLYVRGDETGVVPLHVAGFDSVWLIEAHGYETQLDHSRGEHVPNRWPEDPPGTVDVRLRRVSRSGG